MLFVPFITLLLGFGLGAILLFHLSIQFLKSTRAFVALVLGSIVLTGISYIVSLAISYPLGMTLVQIVLGLAVSFYLWRTPALRQEIASWFSALKQDRAVLLLLIGTGLLFFALFDSHIIPTIRGDLATGESTYGDLPFHLTTISQIVTTHKLPPDNPFLADQQLAYPFLANFHSAMLVSSGWSLRLAILVPGILFSLGLVTLMYDFFMTVLKRRGVALLAIALYLGQGGAGFLVFLRDYQYKLPAMLQAILDPATMIRDYSHVYAENIQWANFTTRLIVPERSIILGIPAGIILLRLLFFRDTKKELSWVDIALTAFLLSLMPLLHTHTVLVFAILFPVLFLLQHRLKWPIETLKKYAWIIGLTTILALPHIPLFVDHLSSSEGFFTWHPWWLKTDTESPLSFWFKNSYVLLPLAAALFLYRSKETLQACYLLIGGFALFAVMNMFQFQPYHWDNVKFLIWAGMFFAMAAAWVIVQLLNYNKWYLHIAVAITITTMLASAGLSILREVSYSAVLFDREAVALGAFVRRNTTPDTRFLTYQVHNSPVSNLAGRHIIMGYPGMLWVHGIDYSQTGEDTKAMYSGGERAKELLTHYNIDYVVLEDDIPNDMHVNHEFFSQYPVVFQNAKYIVYRIK